MKVQNVNFNHSPQFKGFKNVVSNTIQLGNDDSFSYMGMELDNKNYPDLDKWKYLQKEFLCNNKLSDYIIFTQLKLGKSNILSLETQIVSPEETKPRSIEESLNIKAIDLIASLTKRIFYLDHIEENKYLYKVVANNLLILQKIFNNQDFAEDICMLGTNKVVKPRKTADIINTNIVARMNKYFKL